MPLRRAGTVQNAGARYGPGSAAHRFAKSYALRCVRGTRTQNIKYRCAIGSTSAGAQVSNSPSARTS